MVEISTSILSVKKGEESSTFFELEAGKTDYFHIDVMDGKFVEKNTYKKMLEYASYIKRISNLPLDVHLMVENVKEAINDFLSVEPNIITFHLEACKSKEEVFEIIKYIKENNCKVGISIKPDTKIEEIYEFLPYIHMCLVMTVEPGKGGQTLIKDTLKKIEELKRYIENNNIGNNNNDSENDVNNTDKKPSKNEENLAPGKLPQTGNNLFMYIINMAVFLIVAILIVLYIRSKINKEK